MFRVLFINGVEHLDHQQFETEAAAEDCAVKTLAMVGCEYTRAQILRPIAELAPVTTIQRRPMNVQMGGGDA